MDSLCNFVKRAKLKWRSFIRILLFLGRLSTTMRNTFFKGYFVLALKILSFYMPPFFIRVIRMKMKSAFLLFALKKIMKAILRFVISLMRGYKREIVAIF